MQLFDDATVAEHVATGAWTTSPFRNVIERHAIERPDAVAIVSEHERMTWSHYLERARRLSEVLVALCPPDARVAVVLPDGPAVHVTFLATEMAGVVAVGIGARAGDHEIAHLMTKTGATTLVLHDEHRGRTAAALADDLRARGAVIDHVVTLSGPPSGGDQARVDGGELEPARRGRSAVAAAERGLGPNDLWLLNSTSGTTGLPKCVTQFHNRWGYFHQLAVGSAGLTADDRFMSVVPAPFGFGLWTAHFTPAFLGAPVVVLDHFSPARMVEMIERERVTVLGCVSTQFVMLLNEYDADRHDLSSLRVMFTGGEAVPVARASEFEDRVGAAVLQFYGSNETGALSCTTLTDTRERRLTTAGRLIDGMHVRLLDPDDHTVDLGVGSRGQPACRGPATCAGYYDDPAANEQLYTPDGWMLMGDICTIDDEGYLQVVGRTSDFIIRGGKNISAVAVEQEVATHPAVRLAAAVAMPDPVFGERVCVFVEVEDGTLTLDDLVEHLRSRGVSREWWPERLEVRGSLPRSSGEKIAKGELRAEVRDLVGES
jgi:acyl-CoA synthetase